MRRQYNFSSREAPPEPEALGTVLAIDSGSPVVSVALSAAGRILADRATELRHSSGRILRMIDEVLEQSGIPLTELDLLLGLRGPGSFTGLRVGLATLQGMRLALGLETATLPTLQVLASLAPTEAGQVTACVDALQGRWMTQQFESNPPFSPVSEPGNTSSESLTTKKSGCLVGFDISRLRARLRSASNLVLVEPGPLATQALRILHLCPPDRNPGLLSSPLYLRAPAVTQAKKRSD